MNEVNSFKFYRDYYNLIKLLPTKSRLKMAWLILEYVFDDINTNMTENEMAIFNTLSKQINKSKEMSIRGKKGGAPEGNKNAEKKQAEKQPKKQASKQAEKQTNIVSSFMFLVYSFKFNNNINNLLKEYLELRIKNKYNMSENIVNRLCNKLIQYSKTDSEKEEIILNAINGSWKDFYPLTQTNNYQEKTKKNNEQWQMLEEVYNGTIKLK